MDSTRNLGSKRKMDSKEKLDSKKKMNSKRKGLVLIRAYIIMLRKITDNLYKYDSLIIV